MQTEHSSIQQLRLRAATEPQCLVGYRLQFNLDGATQEGVCVGVEKRRGKSTAHVLQNAEGEEQSIILERKDARGGAPASKKLLFGILGKEPARPLQHGYLTKQAVHSKRNWKRRFFVLNGLDCKLRWWETQATFLAGAAEKGSFDLTRKAQTSCALLAPGQSPKGFAHCVRLACAAQNTVLTISAGSMAEAKAWQCAVDCTLAGQTHNEFTVALGTQSQSFMPATDQLCGACGLDFVTFSGATVCASCMAADTPQGRKRRLGGAAATVASASSATRAFGEAGAEATARRVAAAAAAGASRGGVGGGGGGADDDSDEEGQKMSCACCSRRYITYSGQTLCPACRKYPDIRSARAAQSGRAALAADSGALVLSPQPVEKRTLGAVTEPQRRGGGSSPLEAELSVAEQEQHRRKQEKSNAKAQRKVEKRAVRREEKDREKRVTRLKAYVNMPVAKYFVGRFEKSKTVLAAWHDGQVVAQLEDGEPLWEINFINGTDLIVDDEEVLRGIIAAWEKEHKSKAAAQRNNRSNMLGASRLNGFGFF